MEDYLYSQYELALIFQYHGFDIVHASELLNKIYHYDNAFLQAQYRDNQKKFILDVMDMMNYINNQAQFELEKSAVNQDLSDFGLINSIARYDNSDIIISHMIFKELRIRILYISKQGFVKMKLSTLLSELGYKRRSQDVINYIIDCLLFYHISVSLKDNIPCDVEKVKLSDMIMFRIV